MAIDRLPVKNTIIVTGVLVAAAFLAGFLPSYAKGKRLESELKVALQQNRVAQLRDLAALAYLQASQKNYGLAAATTAQYFALAPAVTAEVPDPTGKKALQDLMNSRDRITSELAKGDPGVLNSLESLLLTTRQATDSR
jgi:RecA/RadA recombinase